MGFENVLVTGGAGRLGRYVVRALRAHGSVTVLDRAAAPSPDVDIAADVRDLAAVTRAMRGHDAVVHLAAIDAGVSAPPEVIFDTNVRGTWNVLHAAHEAGIRKVVVCSSVSALGLDYTNRRLPPLYVPVDEAHPLRPTQAYGLSKEVNETISRSFASRGRMEVICLRPAWIMFPDTLRRAIAAGDSEVLPLLRSYVTPEDLARSFRLALDLRTSAYDVFFITAADTLASEATLPYLERAYGMLPEVRKPELYAARPRASVYDISHAREVLGWSPSQEWADVVARATSAP